MSDVNLVQTSFFQKVATTWMPKEVYIKACDHDFEFYTSDVFPFTHYN